jgi:RNA-directed DNA polymerase
MAVKAAREYIQEGFEYVVDIDLEQFFDRVNHDILMAKVARRVKDKQTLTLIRSYLSSGVMENGVVISTPEGTPQGGPLSPLLANIMLDDMDHELEKRGHPFVRYADDITIFVKSKRAGERVLSSMRGYIQTRLHLLVNEGKSAVGRPGRRKILGFSFYKRQGTVKIRIAKQAIKKFKSKVRKMTRRTTHGTITEIIKGMNIYLTGWTGYYHLAETGSVFMDLDEWVRHRLRQIIWKRWKQGRTRFRKLINLGIPKEKAAIGAKGAGYWGMSNNYIVKFALNNAYWGELGLKSILTCVENFRTV